MVSYILIGLFVVAVLVFLSGIRIIRPTHRGVVETLGKYSGFKEAGFNWIVPIFQDMKIVNVTEQMQAIDSHEAITKDNLNVGVDLVVYYKVNPTEDDVKASQYNVEDFESQIISLSQTTARNVIGNMAFKEVNSQRHKLNADLAKILDKETKSWGIGIVRVELKEIRPPSDVQDTMNKIIKAENEKDAATDFATAAETKADGIKRAAIKEAEGIAKGKIIVAEAEAQKIKLVNEAAQKYFTGKAQELKRLEVTEAALKDNAKIIITEKGISPSIILGNLPVDK